MTVKTPAVGLRFKAVNVLSHNQGSRLKLNRSHLQKRAPLTLIDADLYDSSSLHII
jgi:hypothetical protein